MLGIRAIDRGDTELALHASSAFHAIAPAASAGSLVVLFPAGDAPQVYAFDAATGAAGAHLGAATAELTLSSLGIVKRSGKLTDRFNWWNALQRAAETGKSVQVELSAGGVQASTNMMPDCYGALPGMMSKLTDRQGNPAWLTKRYYARPTMPAFGQPLPARASVRGGLSPLKNDAFIGHRPGRHELCAGAAIGTIARLLKDRINGASRMLGHFFMYEWLRGDVQVKLLSPRVQSLALPKLVLEALMLRECGHQFKGKFTDKEAPGAFAATAIMIAFGFATGNSARMPPSLETSNRGNGANAMMRTMASEGLTYQDVSSMSPQQIDDLGVSDLYIDACRDMGEFLQSFGPGTGSGWFEHAMAQPGTQTDYAQWANKVADAQPAAAATTVSANDGSHKFALREDVTDTTCSERALRVHSLSAALSLSAEEIDVFGQRPLGALYAPNVVRTAPVAIDAPTTLPAACRDHRNAQSDVAKELLGTVELDLKEAHDGTVESSSELVFLLTSAIESGAFYFFLLRLHTQA